MVRSATGTIKSPADQSLVKEELVAKLQNEISMEEELKEDEDLSTNIKEYLENSPFEVCTVRSRMDDASNLSSWKTSPDTKRSLSPAPLVTRKSASPSAPPT